MGFPDVKAADHHILVGGRPAFTYFTGGEVHVGYDGPPPEGARAVLFPGWEQLTGVVPVSTVLADSAIEQVVILGGLTAVPEMLIDTGGFVRPIWRAGVLTLVTQFGRGGVLTPFEAQAQIPCCHDH
ncbi:hypothetical protein ACFO1B_45675 [Dactylosporangium siamense]|uniref:Uncharacterized protein n=1 Tax=Dactylosporangium siamense TaxID=685454 RepID=A0A919U8K3_9ACTN|nr:hypothetical protein [Dactylosporangium siamense]GIG45822.1 hypothetical protein Dsi01nite_038630 [Dactylosporangium siamense]